MDSMWWAKGMGAGAGGLGPWSPVARQGMLGALTWVSVFPWLPLVQTSDITKYPFLLCQNSISDSPSSQPELVCVPLGTREPAKTLGPTSHCLLEEGELPAHVGSREWLGGPPGCRVRELDPQTEEL